MEALDKFMNFINQYFYFWLLLAIFLYVISLYFNEIKYFLYKVQNSFTTFFKKIFKRNKIKNNIKNTNDTNPNLSNLNINEAQDLLNFLDELIKRKFNFYFIYEILPYYSAGERIDKSKLKELQEKFFIDISATINKDTKKLFKKYFTTTGIELYINERFLYYINKIDANFAEDKLNPADFI
jgi:hypothetical protein